MPSSSGGTSRERSHAGIAVYLPHLRGHGLSGDRGRMGSPRRVLEDLSVVLQEVRAVHPNAEVALGGESMGGLFALAYAASSRPSPDRWLLLVPALRPGRGSWLKTGAGRVFRSGGAVTSMHAPNPHEAQRSEEYRQRVRSDPLALQHPSFAYLLTIARHVRVHAAVPEAWHNLLWDPTAPDTIAFVRRWLLHEPVSR